MYHRADLVTFGVQPADQFGNGLPGGHIAGHDVDPDACVSQLSGKFGRSVGGIATAAGQHKVLRARAG
jgi:hypothetical protein